jgi:hypothetical protein
VILHPVFWFFPGGVEVVWAEDAPHPPPNIKYTIERRRVIDLRTHNEREEG